jgi:hypothetical protein
MAFCSTRADITFYGGQAGGGKTAGLVLDFARLARGTGGAGVIFRRTSPELVGGGSIWETAKDIYGSIPGANLREHPVLEARFNGGGTVEFRHLQYEQDAKGHQGKQYARVGFDEVTHFTPYQWWYLISRMRSGAGWRAKCKNTCNPDPTSFVRGLIDYWIGEDGLPIPERSGQLRYFVRDGEALHWSEDAAKLISRYPHLVDPVTGPLSMTFIPATLDDNPALLKADPGYRARLMSLEPTERARLLGGNWNIVDTSKLVYAFDGKVNGVDTVPDYDAETWIHTLAVDFGMVDECAWVVLASHPHRNDIYAIQAFKKGGLLPEEAADITAGLVGRYKPYTLVGDAGGLGKPYVEAWNRRMGASAMAMVAAEKTEKLAHIKLLNGDLRKPRLFLLRPMCQPLISELIALKWADDTRTREHPTQPNHCADGLLYGWRHHTAYLHSAPTKNTPTVHLTPDDDKYVEREEDEAREAAGREWWDA